MEYKVIPCQIRYEEKYLPNKRCRNVRKHVALHDYEFRLMMPAEDEFPVACILHEDQRDIEIRYMNKMFWSKCHKSRTIDKVVHDAGIGIYSGGAFDPPLVNSSMDIDQGWNENAIIQKSDKLKKRLQYVKQAYEKKYAYFDGAVWFAMPEPRYEMNIYPQKISMYVPTYMEDYDMDVTRKINPKAYNLRDRKIMEQKAKELVNSMDEDVVVDEEEVELLMPRIFKFGRDAGKEIRKFPVQIWASGHQDVLRAALREPQADEVPLLSYEASRRLHPACHGSGKGAVLPHDRGTRQAGAEPDAR